MTRDQMLERLAVGLQVLDGHGPDVAASRAETILQVHERQLRELREPGTLCRCCGQIVGAEHP